MLFLIQVVRSVFSAQSWRLHMPFVRLVGYQLAAENRIEVFQNGIQIINPSEGTVNGPIRFRHVPVERD